MICNRLVIIALIAAVVSSCSTEKMPGGGGTPSALAEVPSVRLNYRYEADVPVPDAEALTQSDERNASVQADFDQTRGSEILDKTITSPDGKRVIALYHRPADLPNEFRLDMYAADGRMIRKVTSDLMAVHFPDTIRWSPDSASVAFVAMLRGVSREPEQQQTGPDGVELVPVPSPAVNANATVDANANTVEPDANTNADPNAAPSAPTPEAPTGILTFRTEQLYLCDADGMGTKPITQNEGFIYFYYVWSPDSSMLAALAVHLREWKVLEARAGADAVFIPQGRLRIVEKSGRERRVDDGLTTVQPVWSPDSSKIATAFEHQVRIYDALGNNPTQAGLPLRNQLLLSSQAFDNAQAEQLNADGNQQPTNSNSAPSTLPDPSKLVSFNPIVMLRWTAPELLYFQTAYIKRMKNETDSRTSFARWHRLILTPQAAR